jgi:hypothetical protein
LGLGRAVTGEGSMSRLSYNANFSSTSGVLSAQFGIHYLSYRDKNDGPLAHGVSAGGVALFSIPLGQRFPSGVPRSSFGFYVGGVPTALISGQLNFISVPLVLGIGMPLSPAPWITIAPWLEISPGFDFDTEIHEVSTASAIQSAMDGTLTRAEVEALVDEGLQIKEETSVGKRAGLAIGIHLGARADLALNFTLGQGHGSAAELGAGLVVRWDDVVPGVQAALAGPTGTEQPVPRAPTPPPVTSAPPPVAPSVVVPASKTQRHKPAAATVSAPPPPPAPAPAPKPAAPSLPPLQAAPPRPR